MSKIVVLGTSFLTQQSKRSAASLLTHWTIVWKILSTCPGQTLHWCSWGSQFPIIFYNLWFVGSQSCRASSSVLTWSPSKSHALSRLQVNFQSRWVITNSIGSGIFTPLQSDNSLAYNLTWYNSFRGNWQMSTPSALILKWEIISKKDWL